MRTKKIEEEEWERLCLLLLLSSHFFIIIIFFTICTVTTTSQNDSLIKKVESSYIRYTVLYTYTTMQMEIVRCECFRPFVERSYPNHCSVLVFLRAIDSEPLGLAIIVKGLVVVYFRTTLTQTGASTWGVVLQTTRGTTPRCWVVKRGRGRFQMVS